MISAFPLALLALILVFVLCLVVGLIGGWVILPGYLIYHNRGELNWCHVLLALPLYALIFPFVGMIIVWYFALPYLERKFKLYVVTIELLIESPEVNNDELID
jgi:hypothetical protein